MKGGEWVSYVGVHYNSKLFQVLSQSTNLSYHPFKSVLKSSNSEILAYVDIYIYEAEIWPNWASSSTCPLIPPLQPDIKSIQLIPSSSLLPDRENRLLWVASCLDRQYEDCLMKLNCTYGN